VEESSIVSMVPRMSVNFLKTLSPNKSLFFVFFFLLKDTDLSVCSRIFGYFGFHVVGGRYDLSKCGYLRGVFRDLWAEFDGL